MINDKKTKTLEKFAIGESLIPVVQLAVEGVIPLLLSGDSGIGKSEFVHRLAHAMGKRVVVLNMALFESAAELLGLPVIDGKVTRYAKPAMLPEGEDRIILIEEATRAAPHVMAGFYEFLTSRRIGDYELPADCAIIACMNPPGPDYDGHPFDKAMSDRFMHVEVVASRDEWLPWAIDAGVHAAVLDTVREDVRLFSLASPRSWYRASRLLQSAQRQDMDRLLIERVLGSELGSFEAAHAVGRYLDGIGEDRAIAPADVLNHYRRDPRICRRVRKLLREGRTDTIEKLVFGVQELLEGDALAGLLAADGFDLTSLEKFVGDIPGDRAAGLLRTFGANPAASTTLDVEPKQALLGYAESPLARFVGKWRKAGWQHRLTALAQRVADFLEQMDANGHAKNLKETKPVLASLGQLCEDLGGQAEPLLKMLRRLGLEPVAAEAAE